MLSAKLRLASAVMLAAASLTLLAVTLNSAKTTQGVGTAASPLKARILRHKDKVKNKPDAAEIAALKKQAKAQDPEERQLEDTTPKHLPIKVKIRKEKEAKFKDLKNDRWVRDLEIEVRNSGTKPIYFLHLQLHLDLQGPDGQGVGFVLLYGRTELVDVKTAIKPEDVSIKPGETHIFTIADRHVKGYEGMITEHQLKHPKKVKVIFQQITFGDGTGWWNAAGEPLPNPKRAANGVCDPKDAASQKQKSWPLIAFNANPRSRWVEMLPDYLPANFLPNADPSQLTLDAGSAPDLCCPGTSCTWAKPSFTRCYCSNIYDLSDDIPSVEFPACTDSTGACSTINSLTRWCEYPNTDGSTFTQGCPFSVVYPCFESAPTPPAFPSPTVSPTPSSPTPTPTPTPEPTCNPATKPNDLNCYCNTTVVGADPFWDCGYSCNGATGADYTRYQSGGPRGSGAGGCPPNKYNDGRDCCRCVVTTCLDGQSANVATCECPSPTPTPIPPSTGGGGDAIYTYHCTPYFWVWYVSFDGGQTWHETGQVEYAGCW